MGRKRLGVLIGQSDENTQRLFLQGFMQKAYALDYDVCVFSMQQKYHSTVNRDIGDSSIFDLVNYDLLDGIVYMKDTVQTKPGVSEKLEEAVYRGFDGPVIVIDQKSKYFESINIDHTEPIRRLVDHLIEIHGYKNIVFLNGKFGHPHSVQRLQGYMESMEAHGLTVTEDMIFYGDYWYDSGNAMVDTLTKRPEGLPEAIACANDCMAIGVCKKLTSLGYHIPEDVAVIGYDSTEEGRYSPVGITSAYIPAKSCGDYAAMKLDAMLKGEEEPEFDLETELYIGGSCGCKVEENIETYRRKTWDSEQFKIGYTSCLNHIIDELLSQEEEKDFFYTVFRYVYQIRDFASFSLCLNEDWSVGERMPDYSNVRFTNRMQRVIKCGPKEDEGNTISFDEYFNKECILPELTEERERPTTFFFTPLFFESRIFGYSAISYGDEAHSYGDIYRMWIRNVVQCMEAFRRQHALRNMLEKMEATQIRDALTGMYNYRGFLKRSQELADTGRLQGKCIVTTAIDLNRLKDINAGYGRNEGDEAIQILAAVILKTVVRGEIAARMGNDEFIIASVVPDESDTHGDDLIEIIYSRIEEYNKTGGKPYSLEVCCGTLTRVVQNMDDLEHLVNDTVSLKNCIKQETMFMLQESKMLSAEDMENDDLVKDILDNNRFTYNFQPIVNARTGEIFAYEALMRADIEKKLSPPVILQCAKRLGRLYDVEKATFYNVLNYVVENESLFEGKKVFINSIPGCSLTGKDKEEMDALLAKYRGKIVVEFTEENEIEDGALKTIKESYDSLNVETAIDDYGSGYSNVNNLLRYMPRYVKVDRMLITEIQDNPQKQHFVKDIIEFAHDNDILALAEGVETTHEMKEAIRLGVDLIQGYYTAKPAPAPVEQITQHVAAEIVQYTQADLLKVEKKSYAAGSGKRLSLIQLAMNKYTDIMVGDATATGNEAAENRIEIVGGSGFESNITIATDENYVGEIVLDNVSLAGDKGKPCLRLGEGSRVTLTLVGENKMRTGGVQVPESASLTVRGDGNLFIIINNGRYYGIGNDYNSKHGKISFEQDGFINISANGMKGVGIGSGLGGEIYIKSGGYDITLNGQDGVAIGAIDADSRLDIQCCDITINHGISNGVIIGSLKRNAYVFMENVSARIISSAHELVGIGSLMGEKADVTLSNGSFSINIMASGECYGIGGPEATCNLDVRFALLRIEIQGKKCLAIGDLSDTSSAHIFNSALDCNVLNNIDKDLGILPENLQIINGRSSFMLNNEIIFRDIENGEL